MAPPKQIGLTLTDAWLQLRRQGVHAGSDVVQEAIKAGLLSCHVLLNNNTVIDFTRKIKRRRHGELTGYYRLPVKEAIAILKGHQDPLLNKHSVTLVVEEPDCIGRFVGWRPTINELRLLPDELQRFQREHFPTAPVEVKESKSKAEVTKDAAVPLRQSQIHRERCRAVAALIWEREPTLTIEDMIDRKEITTHGQQGVPYGRGTLRNWIKDLCPDRKPGRRPEKK